MPALICIQTSLFAVPHFFYILSIFYFPQGVIQVGKRMPGYSDVQWSNELRLLEQFEARSRVTFETNQIEEVSPHSSTSITIINPNRKSCLQFALSSKIRNGIIVVNIKERFCVHNATGVALKCFPTLYEREDIQVNTSLFFGKTRCRKT